MVEDLEIVMQLLQQEASEEMVDEVFDLHSSDLDEVVVRQQMELPRLLVLTQELEGLVLPTLFRDQQLLTQAEVVVVQLHKVRLLVLVELVVAGLVLLKELPQSQVRQIQDEGEVDEARHFQMARMDDLVLLLSLTRQMEVTASLRLLLVEQ